MRYEDRTFEDETMALDGHEFVRCTFKNCRLSYSGGTVGFDQLRFENNTTVENRGAAKSAVELYLALQNASMRAASMGSVISIGDAWFTKTEKPEGLFPN